MPFAICGFIIGIEHHPEVEIFHKLIWITIAMVSARSAAMGFNRLTDWKIDAINPRTEQREIPSGKVSIMGAKLFVISMSLVFIAAAWQLNTLCLILSPIALLLILGYSYTKRFTSLSHLILGISLSLAPLGSYIAVSNSISIQPIILSMAVAFWSAGFDIIYSLQDQQFDKKNHLHSIPAKFGFTKAKFIAAFMHTVSCLALILLLKMRNYQTFILIGTFIFIILIINQHIIVNRQGIKRINMAFFTLNGAASMVYCIFFVIDHFNFA